MDRKVIDVKQYKTFGAMIALAFFLISCTPVMPSPDQPPAIEIQKKTQSIPDTPTLPPPATDSPGPSDPQVEYFPLAERGSFWVGHRSYILVDNSRSGREIRITIWYPAEKNYNSSGQPISLDAIPDLGSAPYPLILVGGNSGDLLFKSHLASTGFVMVIVHSPNFKYEDPWGPIVIDGPRDFLFTLDQLAASPPEDLVNLIDTNQVGVAGYSWDGFFTLALSGVRIDPDFYLSQCASAPGMVPALSPSMQDYYCGLANNWDEFVAHAGEEITVSDDRLWQPVTDQRIRAVMPMAPDGAWLYGEGGLSVVNTTNLDHNRYQ